MPGLVPGIHAVQPMLTINIFKRGVDGRDKHGHDAL
jgi:hypothetical protein